MGFQVNYHPSRRLRRAFTPDRRLREALGEIFQGASEAAITAVVGDVLAKLQPREGIPERSNDNVKET